MTLAYSPPSPWTRPPPLAAGDRVLISGARYVLLDADWTVGKDGFEAVRFYLDKAADAPGGLGE